MSFINNLLVSLDQLGNVLAGGNPDNTISARVGYYTEEYYKPNEIPFQWKFLRSIIDFSFYPVDGAKHCKESYFNDAGEEFDKGTSDFAIAILAILIITSCIIIATLLYLLYAFNIVSPKKINRTENIKKRLQLSEAKLKGVYSELNQYQVEVDEELDEIIDKTENTLEEIVAKIDGILRLKKRLSHFKKKR